jgi:hypothetical protein
VLHEVDRSGCLPNTVDEQVPRASPRRRDASEDAICRSLHPSGGVHLDECGLGRDKFGAHVRTRDLVIWQSATSAGASGNSTR